MIHVAVVLIWNVIIMAPRLAKPSEWDIFSTSGTGREGLVGEGLVIRKEGHVYE